MSFPWNLWSQTSRADAGTPAGARDPSDDNWFSGARRRSEINVDVTVARARQIPVVRDCLAVLSDSISGLPFAVRERLENGDSREVEDHPVAAILRNPNPRQTGVEFLSAAVDDLSAYGEFFA